MILTSIDSRFPGGPGKVHLLITEVSEVDLLAVIARTEVTDDLFVGWGHIPFCANHASGWPTICLDYSDRKSCNSHGQ